MRLLILTLSLMLAIALPARADTVISAETIATEIAARITARVPTNGRYRVVLSDPAYQLVLPTAAEGRYDIAALTFDPLRQSFAATLSFKNQAGVAEYVRLAGAAGAVIDAPALVRDAAMGEIIAEADLTTVEVPAMRTSVALLISAVGVVGQAAKRPLRAGAPLFAYDLKKPVLVKKGELVTVVYALPGIELTTQGQAQADAGKGDTISILNTRSRRTIEARVTGPGTVSASAPAAIATN